MGADHEALLRPIARTSWAGRALVALLLGVVAWGGYGYFLQLRDGLAVTGLGRPVYWGMYILNLVFFIGVSYGGTLASAVLRLVGAEWRRPITRAAEATTVCALLVGGPQPLIDLGRLDRARWILLHPQLRSPMLWDILSISAYLALSTLYLWLALVPDLAWLRDRGVGGPARRALYRVLAAGYRGAAAQRRRLDRALFVMAIVVIPVAVSAHTVLSWVPGLSLVPMWHSALFGPYFVLGAVFSGVATIIVALAIVRWVYRLDGYVQPRHFANLGFMLLALSAAWTYFTFAEHLTAFYGKLPEDLAVARDRVYGPHARLFWGMVLCCGVAPLLLGIRRLRTVAGTAIASLLVLVGMWVERFLILVPSQAHPRVHPGGATYAPSWVEWAELSASLAAFALLYIGFLKLFPVVSRWEVEEGPVLGAGEVRESALPRPVESA